ncbi:cubilin-like isoform X2 [Haliotis rufescens]|uniref:cubilin-like isoform X2 n=1 Tax=Haliotis rufescens TaxID=6454 RepID=UPI00201F85A2|nr:cubilin-like isoform X2 [Haliotis rufescens]
MKLGSVTVGIPYRGEMGRWKHTCVLLLSVLGTVCGQCSDGPLHLTISKTTSISLPTDSGLYKSDLHCQWNLTSGSSDALQLEFETFSLQDSPECINDYLEIYSSSGDLIDRWCGDLYPEYIVMNGGSIIFHSDDRVSSAGFVIKVKYIFVASFQNIQFPVTATTKPKLLYAPFYGESNVMRLRFFWKVTRSEATELTQIHYQDYCDDIQTVSITEANQTSDLLLHDCAYPSHQAIVSATPQLTISVNMPTDGSKQRFRLSVSAVANYPSVCDGGEAVHEVAVTRNPQYIIVPWSIPGLMLKMKKACRWHLQTDLTDHMVVMEMLVYDPPNGGLCSDNRISIYNGADNSSMQLVSACAMSDVFSRVISPQMFVESTILTTPSSVKSAFVMKIHSTPQCEDGVRPLVATTLPSYTVMEYYNRLPDCMLHVKMRNNSMKMLDVGIVSPGISPSFNPSSSCPDNATYIQVYNVSAVLPQYQIPKLCPFLNSHEYRVYGTSLYLPTHPEVNVPLSVVALHYYATQGICDRNKIVVLEVTLEEQSLYSPNFPNTYWPHEVCRWRLHSFSPYYHVAFLVSQFMSQSPVGACTSSQDHIAFYDGPSNSSSRLMLRCAGLDTDWVPSSGSDVYAQFQSFIGNTGKFNIKYKAVRRDSSCNKELQGTSHYQNLSSSGFPTGPVRPPECWWRIEAEPDDQVVSVNVLETDLFQDYYCSVSHVEAYDGKDSTEGLIIKWCSKSTPQFLSTGKYMFLQLHSGSDVDKGFLLTYNSTPAVISPCGTSLTAYNHMSYLSSPGYPENYKNHLDCRWVIRAMSGFTTVKIEVTDAHLEYDCSFDNISIYDGQDMSAKLMGVFCARNRPTLQSSGMFIFIRFQTDSSRTHEGFQVKYYETEDKTAENVCNKDLSSYQDAQYLQSPGYPNSYPSNLECWWRVTASDPSGQVQVTVIRSSIENSNNCRNDYVAVHDGDREGRELGRWCSDETPTYVSSGRSLFLLFMTNMDDTAMGFQLKYFTTKACAAGHVSELHVHLVPGYIESPNYPENYPNDVSCSWRLRTNISSYIRVKVLNSDIESKENCGFDYMIGYDGATDSYPMLKKWCGLETPIVTSSGSVLFLKFRSDGSGNRQGFRIDYVGVNIGYYDDSTSSSSLKAGTIAGVVCGCVVVTSILIIAMFVVIRRRQKYQQNADLDPTGHGRRSGSTSHWRSRRYPDQPWEVNAVFYSVESAGYMTAPPPYSLVAGLHNDPPPPYPAAEFTLPLKDEDEEEVPPCDGPGEDNHAGDGNISPCTPGSERHPGVQSESRAEESPVNPNPNPNPNPVKLAEGGRPHYRKSGGSGLGRAVSVDNLLPLHKPLSVAPPTVLSEMTSGGRAVSVGNLVLAEATGQGYNRQISQSETVLNRGPYSPGATAGQSPYPRSRHRTERRSPGHQQQSHSHNSPPNPHSGLDGAAPSAAGAMTGTSVPEGAGHRYTQRRHPADKAREKRGHPRSEFKALKERSRSHDSLVTDRLSLSNAAWNPRWSVASEGNRNDGWSQSPGGRLGEASYSNPLFSPTVDKTAARRSAERSPSLTGDRMDSAGRRPASRERRMTGDDSAGRRPASRERRMTGDDSAGRRPASRERRMTGDESAEAGEVPEACHASWNLSLEPEGPHRLSTTETSV